MDAVIIDDEALADPHLGAIVGRERKRVPTRRGHAQHAVELHGHVVKALSEAQVETARYAAGGGLELGEIRQLSWVLV